MTLLNHVKKSFFSLFKKQRPRDPIKKLDQKLVYSVHNKKIPAPKQFKYASLFFSRKEKYLIALGLLATGAGIALWIHLFITSHQIQVPTTGGTYREAVIGTPNLFNPLYANQSEVDSVVSALIFSSLIGYDNNAHRTYDLAKEITSNDDQTELTIKVKENIQFHDGAPLNAHDVAFTIQRIQNEDTKSSLRSRLYNVKTNIVDDYTLTLTLESPVRDFEQFLTFGIIPKHLLVNTTPAEMLSHTFNKSPIGSGPYQYTETIHDEISGISTVVLTKNDNYHKGTPFIETVEIKAVASDAQALELFLKQEIDGLAALTTQETKRLQNRANILNLSIPEYSAIFFNQLSNESLRKQAVRDALSLAIDKQKIVEEALSGNAHTAHSPFIPTMPGYIEGEHAFEIDAANQILDDDNWERITEEEFINLQLEDERDGFIKLYKELNENAEPTENEILEALSEKTKEIAITIDPLQPFFRKRNNTILSISITHVDSDDAIKTAEILKNAWRNIGVKVTTISTPSFALQSNVLPNHRYEALLLNIVVGTNPDPFPLWYDAGNENRATIARFVDRALDDLLESIRNTKDDEKREQLYEQFQSKILSKKPAIILNIPTYNYALIPRIQGVNTTGIITPTDRLNNIHQWYIKTKTQWK